MVFGGGCFWCVEAIFTLVHGVAKVTNGYCGGQVINPTYEQVCSGTTGHAEVVEIIYDDKIVSCAKLLEIFFTIHNPTTLNKQGVDEGTQYRSVVYYSNDTQKKIILEAIKRVGKYFNDKIVTEVSKLSKFYVAQEYHQHYFQNHPNHGYCQVVIAPKVQKFLREKI